MMSHSSSGFLFLATLVVGCGDATGESIGTWQEASTYAESGDSGDLPAQAQSIDGRGAPTEITGTLDGDDDVDLYALCLEGGGTFSAAVSAGEFEETQLFLFDAAGRGVYFSDDLSGSDYRSFLPANHPLTPASPGVYYLALSSFNNDPLSASGEIFPNEPYTVIHGPTGPGGADPVSSWSGVGDELGGTYAIDITGATPCPSNEPPDCSVAVASPSVVHVGHGFAPIEISGITDPDGDPIHVTVEAISQDEPVCGLLDPCPDGKGVGTATPRVRRQARLLGNGRMYRVAFTAEDGNGGECEGEVTVGVKPLIGSPTPVEDGCSFDSTRRH
jgi:hypothetical protein